MAMMKEQKNQPLKSIQQVLDSYCQVCFVTFNRVLPKKLEEGEQVCFCVKCKCRVHKCCYDMQANSSFVTNKLREFVCQRCNKKQLTDKACIICHKKDGAMKQIGSNQVIHVFCGLLHNEIITNGYYPEITFKKSQNYKEIRNLCGLCSKPNATQQCAMQSCFKRYHGYCIMENYKSKQLEEDDPQCEKYYFSCGDNGNFDLSSQLMPKGWVFEQFDKVLASFQQYGFRIDDKEKLKEEIYNSYQKQQREEKKNQHSLKRGGFAYILCADHDNPMYCNCLNRGSGDMVQCQCCFEWYHQKCVNYQPTRASQNYVCSYCINFYQLKKKIIQQVKSPRTQAYQLKFQTPKLHLNDYIWLLRVIDHRIAGGGATKMIKQLAKYPLKTSKMELVVRNQNKKKITNITELFIQKYLESKEHEAILKPKVVLGLDEDQKPIILTQNIEYNRKLKKYVDFIQNFVRKNNLPDSFGPVIHELKFKERAIEDNYQTILQLSKSQSGYPQIPILKIKVEEYSFMEVIKDIDSGSMIKFEDLEKAMSKAKNTSSNVPSYLLKPLIQRYEKVKNLVQIVSKNIYQKKQSSSETQNAVKKLKQQKVLPPQIYLNFHEEKKFINELYLLYLKQQGKALQQSIETSDKIEILLKEPTCKPNRQIAECVNSFSFEGESSSVYEHLKDIVNKYSKMCVMYELKQSLKKKSIKLSTLQTLFNKYQTLKITSSDPEISDLITNWTQIRNQWLRIKNQIERSIDIIDDITDLTNAIKSCQEVIKSLQIFPIQIINKNQQVPELGSLNRLQQLKSWVQALAILFTQAQLKKNPLTFTKLPQGLPRQNPLVKDYFSFKKQYNELMSKYNAIYARANQKIQLLKADLKKPRNQQMKENLQKPRMTEVTNFLQQLKQSKVSMQTQIKQLTKTVNKSIQIGSKVNKFISSQKHLQNLFKEEDIDNVKKQIDQLRRKVLIQAQISLQNQLKQLYHAQICVRMQKMIITSNTQLDKMNKLIKFAEQEGLTHLSTYRRLKSKFQVGNQSSKQINLTKKHEQYLLSEAQKIKESDGFYSTLVFARKSLPLSLPQPLKQKNKHYQDLLSRNQYLKTKVDLILSEQPKKYDISQAKPIYLQALKHPFEIEGLNKLINEFQKLQKVQNLWRYQKDVDNSRAEVFLKYEDLVFNIPEISKAKKQIAQIEQMIHSMKRMYGDDLNVDSLSKVEQNLENAQQSKLKGNRIYNKFKLQYFHFWVRLLQKFRKQQNESVPFTKLKSILLDAYTTVQKNIKSGLSNEQMKSIVSYLEDLMVGIKNQFQLKKQDIDGIYQGFIDTEQLKYQVSQGLDIKQEIKILNPFNDLHRFSNLDLQKVHSRSQRNIEDPTALRRQRTQTQLEDPFAKQTKNERSHRNISGGSKNQKQSDNQQWQNNQGNIVSQAQRSKAKQLILKNIKKNPLLTNYQNLPQQVKMIQNQVFGDNHNQIVKYFQLVNSFQKLFIKLLSCPALSAKMIKKKFQLKFLMLLISNMGQISDIQAMLAKQAEQAKQLEKKQAKPAQKQKQKQKEKQKQKQKERQKEKQKQKQKQKEAKKALQQKKQKKQQKQKTIQEMIATGQIDESIRKQMKRQIRAIREKTKKKKHKSSRRRSRSRSKSYSPQAKFSSQSQQIQQPVIQKQFIDTQTQKTFNDPYTPRQTNQAPLLYDPQLEQMQDVPNKKVFPRGSILQIKQVQLQMVLKKKGKITFKSFMMTTQQHQKIVSDLIDPAFNLIQLKRDKVDQEIIQYLNKPSRKKYRFLVGWFETQTRQHNQQIRDFAIQCDQRNKIFGVQNDYIKMHIMSIRQYIKIVQMHDPPSYVTSQAAVQALKYDRLVYVIQYPTQKIYQLKGIYQNFNDIIIKQTSYPVQIPQIQINIPMDRPPYMPNNYMMGYNPLMIPQHKQMQQNPLKPVQIEGWGTSQPTLPSYSVSNYSTQNFNPLNLLSRFSPILTDQQDNNQNQNTANANQQKQKIKQEKQIDLASNILNSLADVNITSSQIPTLPPPQRNYAIESRHIQDPYRYPPQMANHPQQMVHSNQQMPRWQHPGMMPPSMPPMGMPRMNMPYNPMSMAQKYPQQQQRMAPPSAMYKNPMMPNAPYGYPPQAPPNQPKPPGSYDPYNMYPRQ